MFIDINRSLEKYLPKIQIAKPKNEVDYYGFSKYLAEHFRYKNYKYSFSSWVHGVNFGDFSLHKFNIAQYSPLYKIVANNDQKKFLNDNRFNKVIVAGYPYIYIKKNYNIKRYSKSLLVMPPHNTDFTENNYNEQKFINYILKFRKYFKVIYFCIHQKCYQKGLWIKNLNKYDIDFVIGANQNDMNSLLRMKYIFQHFDYVHSSTIGSAIFYAAFEQCKISISNEYLNYELNAHKKHPLFKKDKVFIKNELYFQSKSFVKKKYPFLFNEPQKGTQKVNWAKKELGYENKLPIEELPKILGWKTRDIPYLYLKKYLNFISRKLF